MDAIATLSYRFTHSTRSSKWIKKVDSLQDYNDDESLLFASQQDFAGITNVTLANNQSSDIC